MQVGAPLLASLCCFASLAAAAEPNAAQFKDEHVTVELLSEHSGVKPGVRVWVGLKLTHERHWHTYWMNAGDSGLPTRFDWQLPTGVRAGEIAWPAPKRFELGGLFNFGYEDTVLLPVSIDIAADVKLGASIPISLNARWVVCNDDLCIPGKSTLRIDLPVVTVNPAAIPGNASLFSQARARQPAPAKWQGQAVVTGDQVRIALRGADLPGAAGLDAFPIASKLLNNTPFKIARDGDALTLDAQKSDYFESAPAMLGLVLTQKDKSWRVDIPWTTGNSSAAGTVK
jgi:DsbC/DsbD-like thiol-disulfide interchange protein